MKCVCGYERVSKEFSYEEATFFKSGKRKGEFKEIVRKYKDMSIGDRDFEVVDVLTGITCGVCHTERMYVCPECGTVKMEVM